MGNSPGVWEAAPTACAVVICFASCIGSINRLECEHRRKVCSVSGDVMLSRTGDATSICAITAPHSLPFALAASLKLAFENREVPKVFYFRAHLSRGLIEAPDAVFHHNPEATYFRAHLSAASLKHRSSAYSCSGNHISAL